MTVKVHVSDAPVVVPQKEGGTVRKTSKKKSTSVFTQNKTVQKQVPTASDNGCGFWGTLGNGLKRLACGIGGFLQGGLGIMGNLLQAGGGLLGLAGMAVGNSGIGFGMNMGMPFMGLGFGGYNMGPVGWPFGNGGLGLGGWGCGFPAMFKGPGCCNWQRPTYIARGFNPSVGRFPVVPHGGNGCASNNPLGHYWGHNSGKDVFGFGNSSVYGLGSYGRTTVPGLDTGTFGYC